MEYAASSLSAMEVINNVYKLPSIKQSIRYLHAATGHPKRPTWLKAISQGNYNSWPLLTVHNARKYFPKLEETQLGHMRGARQGVRSTHQCPPANRNPLSGTDHFGLDTDDPPSGTLDKREDILYMSTNSTKNIAQPIQSTATKQGTSLSSPVEATSPSWSCTMLTATHLGSSSSKTKPKACSLLHKP